MIETDDNLVKFRDEEEERLRKEFNLDFLRKLAEGEAKEPRQSEKSNQFKFLKRVTKKRESRIGAFSNR